MGVWMRGFWVNVDVNAKGIFDVNVDVDVVWDGC